MDPYTLFVYSDDGRLIGAGTVIHAANDAEAIAQADATRGAFDPALSICCRCAFWTTGR
jgi:hypothetical protein